VGSGGLVDFAGCRDGGGGLVAGQQLGGS
jgi:hypothetical protein